MATTIQSSSANTTKALHCFDICIRHSDLLDNFLMEFVEWTFWNMCMENIAENFPCMLILSHYSNTYYEWIGKCILWTIWMLPYRLLISISSGSNADCAEIIYISFIFLRLCRRRQVTPTYSPSRVYQLNESAPTKINENHVFIFFGGIVDFRTGTGL